MSTVRLTMAQVLVRYLIAQRVEAEGGEAPMFAGVFAIFGHGNVAGLGEALYAVAAALPTYRAHNEQAMAHAAIAFAKANRRRRMMRRVRGIGPAALVRAREADSTHVVAIDTDPLVGTAEGGAWWDVPVPEVSGRAAVVEANAAYTDAKTLQRI